MASTAEASSRITSMPRSRQTIASFTGFGSPSSPYTPTLHRPASLYGSPGAGGYRSSDEEYIIFELGARFLRAGFHGESAPRCTLAFGPSESRRTGDYRQLMPDYATKRRRTKGGKDWGSEQELWRMDLRELDIGLVEDKLDRALREAYNKYFLLDKPRRIFLALPPLLPRQLLTVVLNVIFNNFQAPSVSLLPSPVLCAVAAGLRSALVVDIGWAETTVTAVYEYREILQRRSVRAGKRLSREMARLLDHEYAKQLAQEGTPHRPNAAIPTTFEEANEVLCRLGWCRSRLDAQKNVHGAEDQVRKDDSDATISVPMPAAAPPTTLELPFSRLADPVETALLGMGSEVRDIDSHNQPLPHLIYNTLSSLAVVTRDICMSRIVITGGVSNLPGIKRRLVEEVKALVEEKDWDRVQSYGTAAGQRSRILQERQRYQLVKSGGTQPTTEITAKESDELVKETQRPASQVIELTDRPHATLAKEAEREQLAEREGLVTGEVRCVESLGTWAGASLLANLRIKGTVEIEKDRYLQHGLAGIGAGQEKATATHQRQSLVPGVRQAAGDRTSWNLGVWA